MKKPDISRYAPLGMNLAPVKNILIWGGLMSFVFSCSYFIALANGVNRLYRVVRTDRVLREGAIMTDFVEVLNYALIGFAILALVMAALAVYNYAYHRQGSKSIYLMRRLPNRWELHKRCLAIPLVSVLMCAAAAFILLCIYYWIYMLVTPEVCLVPGQWQKIWSVLL